MKKILKFTGLIILITFSFFYTDKVTSVIKENDSLMNEIKSEKNKYQIESIPGIIKNNTIIPGIDGRSINIDKSYKKMREAGIFNKDLIIYNKIIPKNNLENNKDKYIIKGNPNKKMVSIILTLNNNMYLDKIQNSINNKNAIINFFVDYKYLLNNSPKIKELNNIEVYNYGNNGEYTPDNILFANNLISRIRSNEAKYCLTTTKELDTIKLCSNNNLYTILPSIITSINPYTQVKNNIESGSIILMETNNNSVIELSIIIDYIKGKGFKIVGLSELLSEDYKY